MKHVVFIVGSYYPFPSAVGTCCFNIAEEMVKKQNKVTVICTKSRIREPKIEEYQGQTIIRVSHRWWDIRLKLNEKIENKSGIIKKLYILLLNCVRIKEYLQIIFSRVSIKRDLVYAYIGALDNIKEAMDVVIPFCLPMEAVIAGMEYKKKKQIKLIPYLFDQFAENKRLHKLGILTYLKMRNHLDLEKAMIDFSDELMVIHSQQKHFKTYFPEVYKKIQFVEHPLLKPVYPVYYKNLREKTKGYLDECVLVFTGSLLKGYVMPNYTFNVLLLARTKMEFVLHLYSGGDCKNTIKKYRRLMPSIIIDHGYVDKKIALKAIVKSNILINIAEIKGIQVSSKIFEYMSTGKPIVHFYTVSDDINVKILKDYPLSLCLKQDEALLRENAEKLVYFCRENKDKTLDFSEVEKKYYHATPKAIVSQILSIINGEESLLPESKVKI